MLGARQKLTGMLFVLNYVRELCRASSALVLQEETPSKLVFLTRSDQPIRDFLMQRGVFGGSLSQPKTVTVSVLPKGQEILIRGSSLGRIG